MSKTRVAILGGGISSLTAAYHLSRTPELRARYEVKVHQLGWRLGGKLASGRQQGHGMRNVEHGLHVWFGFYDNAFNLFKEAFARWRKPAGSPFASWKDAFTPRSYTPIGELRDGKLSYWQVVFPTNDEEPGGDEVALTPEGVVSEILSVLRLIVKDLIDDDDWDEKPAESHSVLKVLGDAVEHVLATPLSLLDGALELAARVDDLDFEKDRYDALRWLLIQFQSHVLPLFSARLCGEIDEHHLYATLDFGTAVALALLNPEYGLTQDWNLDRIDHLELRQLLLDNGATPKVVAEWCVVRALYDAWFEYRDGDPAEPDFAAGAALRVMFRIGFTYKGAVLWLVNAGMGETVISPLYEVLKDQGVKFEFFHKLKHVRLDPSGKKVRALELERQATTKGGKPYEPTFLYEGMVCWPCEPLWEQLEQGDELRRQGVDLESHWCSWGGGRMETLELGRDFDAVVLGICAGAYARLNEEPSICQEVIDRSPAFRRFTESVGLVPSTGVQLWVTKDLEQLGFEGGPPAMVHGSYPNDVWADMTHTLRLEGWSGTEPPRGVHYLCGTIGTRLYARPSSDAGVPEQAKALVLEATRAQLENPTAGIASVWPRALRDGRFDWSVLYDPQGGVGPERLKAQFVRANVDPTECCVGTATGTTAARLGAAETGVDNLYLAGEGARTGMNSSCVEGAVMAGMQAAAAITGVELKIVGDDFMKAPPASGRRRGRVA